MGFLVNLHPKVAGSSSIRCCLYFWRDLMDLYALIALVIAVVIAAILVWIIVPKGPRI